jgi:hypothetical protein
MCYAFKTNTADLVEHGGRETGKFKMTLSLSDNSTCLESSGGTSGDSEDVELVHGWVLWAAWFILGLA